MAGFQRSQRLERMARKADGGIVFVSACLAAETSRRSLGGGFLAERIRRAQRYADAANHFLGRDGQGRSATHGQLARARPHWSNDYRVRNGGAEEALHSKNSERRGDLVPRLFRAECGFRPGRIANGSAFGGRPLRRERPKSVDELRLGWQLVRTRCSYRRECGETQRAHGIAGGHEITRRGGSSAAPDDRRIRVQRTVFSRCASSSRKCSGQGE